MKALAQERPRQTIVRWVREATAGPSFKIPAVARELTDRIVADKAFLRQYIEAELRALITQQVRQIVSDSRGLMVEAGDEVMSRAEFLDHAVGQWARKFAGWVEYAGDRHVHLGEMTREDLLVAASTRRAAAASETEIAELWEALAARLEGGERVSERFDATQIAEIHRQLRERKAA